MRPTCPVQASIWDPQPTLLLDKKYYLLTIAGWAILLINDDGVVDILHINVLKGKIEDIACKRASPCLDPQAILSAIEGAVSHSQSTYIVFISRPTKASDTDAMAGATLNICNVYA